MRTISTLLFLLIFAETSFAQIADTTISWKDYSRIASAEVEIFDVKDDKKRSFAIVINEIAENNGSPATDDARFVIQKIARDLGIDPVDAYWIFRWTALSFARPKSDQSKGTSKKQLLLMGTMGRSKANTLTGPSWRIITAQRLTELTDRQWNP